MDISVLMREFQNCPCGREHATNLKALEVYSGALSDAGKILREAHFPQNIHIIADKNTLAASDGLLGVLAAEHFTCSITVFEEIITADIAAVQRVSTEGKDSKAFLAIGSGSVNDIAKYASFLMGLPYAVFATAPSMDGYASTVAALVDGGLKKSLPAHSPEIIIADCTILASSPARLKSAGYGDMIGKYTALLDWKIANIFTGEYFCERIAHLTLEAVETCVALTDKVTSSDAGTAGTLMEALVLAGIAMQLCGNSRPAAGAEHLISHFWEMKHLDEGKKVDLHGKKVGIATVLVARCYRELLSLGTITAANVPLDKEGLTNAYGESLAAGMITLNTPHLLEQIDAKEFAQRWGEVREELLKLPEAWEIQALLARAGVGTKPEDAGISEKLTTDALLYGCYAQRKLTLLQMIKMIDNYKINT